MTIAPTVVRHLTQEGVAFEVRAHPFAGSASEVAHAAHLPGDRLAKAVLLRAGSGYVLAVLPASHHLELAALRQWLGDDVALASEQEAGRWFKDCEVGALPPLGDAYGLEVVLDERLAEAPEVWFEAGDHRSLIRVSGAQFAALMAGARRRLGAARRHPGATPRGHGFWAGSPCRPAPGAGAPGRRSAGGCGTGCRFHPCARG